MTDEPVNAASLIARWAQVDAQLGPATVSSLGSVAGGSSATGVGEAIQRHEGSGGVVVGGAGEYALVGADATLEVSAPEWTVGAVLIGAGPKTDEGHLVLAVTPAWRRILSEAAKDPKALLQLSARQFEEFVAGGYEQAGFDVTLTPRSGDRGRDIIAHRCDVMGPTRLLVEVKRLRPDRRVTAKEVRAFSDVLTRDGAASKGVFTTTSRFAPGVYKDFVQPTRLELIDGEGMRDWLRLIRRSAQA
jgi:restriction system protein